MIIHIILLSQHKGRENLVAELNKDLNNVFHEKKQEAPGMNLLHLQPQFLTHQAWKAFKPRKSLMKLMRQPLALELTK